MDNIKKAGIWELMDAIYGEQSKFTKEQAQKEMQRRNVFQYLK